MTQTKSTRWTKGMSKEEADEFHKHWVASEEVRKQLGVVLYDMVVETQKQRIRLEEYDSPNWHLRQIHWNTREKVLLEIYNLL